MPFPASTPISRLINFEIVCMPTSIVQVFLQQQLPGNIGGLKARMMHRPAEEKNSHFEGSQKGQIFQCINVFLLRLSLGYLVLRSDSIKFNS